MPSYKTTGILMNALIIERNKNRAMTAVAMPNLIGIIDYKQ